jgi:trimeric autotransporter adhesin
MSTKTLRKRIALVAVAALGFGLVSGTPANAAPAVGPLNYTSALTQSWTALTVVGNATTGSNGFFYVDTTNLQTPAVVATTDTNALPLQTGETIQVSVASAPTGRAVTDLNINSVTNTGALPATPFIDGVLAGGMGDEDILVADTDAVKSPNSSYNALAALNNESNRYWFTVNTDTAAALGAGKYTIRVRLTNVNSQVIDYTMTVKFVATIADAGSVLTLAKTGSITFGKPFATTVNTSVLATLRDADGGRIQKGQATTGQRLLWAPALNANMMAAGVVGTDVLTITDNGVKTEDFVLCGEGGAAACTTPAGGITQEVSQASLATGDGVYGLKAAGDIVAAASSTSEVRVRVDGTSVSTSITVPVIVATTAVLTGTTVLMTATGIALTDQAYRAIGTITAGASTIAYTLPLTATTAKLTVELGTTSTAGEALTATTTWSGNYATASVTPASANVQTVYTDADGRVVINLANTTPVATGKATVKLTGFATVTESLTITTTWSASTLDSLLVVDPVAGVYAALKATTVVTVLARDQFGNALAGEMIQPSLGVDSANYSATTKFPAITTGANGTATFTWTDALAAADDEDNLLFTSVTNAKPATFDLVYKTTVPAATTLTGFQSSTQSAAGTAALGGVAARGVSISSSAGLTGTLMIARNLSKSLAALTTGEIATDDMYAVRIRAVTSTGAAATGAAVTLTASTGGWVQDVTGLPATSRTVAVDANGDAYFQILATATGTLTFTATSGTSSFAFPLTIADQTFTAARFVTITGATTGTANGAGVPVSATVTDRYGNGVANVTLTVTASGVGAFMGGSTSQSFTTDATGKYTFLATSYNAAGGSATYSVNATNATDATSVAGYSSTTIIDSTVLAGNKAASVTVTFAEGTNAAEANAQAATDAAAEATDAANAATDAANAAAEAADAATAAAQDAADAVAALSTQVSEMVNALKKQITALTNLVIKIQKKVKA